MIDLLIAILIALGCNISSGNTADQLKAADPDVLQKSIIIQNDENRSEDGGLASWDFRS